MQIEWLQRSKELALPGLLKMWFAKASRDRMALQPEHLRLHRTVNQLQAEAQQQVPGNC